MTGRQEQACNAHHHQPPHNNMMPTDAVEDMCLPPEQHPTSPARSGRRQRTGSCGVRRGALALRRLGGGARAVTAPIGGVGASYVHVVSEDVRRVR